MVGVGAADTVATEASAHVCGPGSAHESVTVTVMGHDPVPSVVVAGLPVASVIVSPSKSQATVSGACPPVVVTVKSCAVPHAGFGETLMFVQLSGWQGGRKRL